MHCNCVPFHVMAIAKLAVTNRTDIFPPPNRISDVVELGGWRHWIHGGGLITTIDKKEMNSAGSDGERFLLSATKLPRETRAGDDDGGRRRRDSQWNSFQKSLPICRTTAIPIN
jgi:hypothetical protein